MIDRLNESAQLRDFLSENSDRKTIMIIAERGAGGTCFVNFHCPPDEQLHIERKNSESFAHSLFSVLLDKYQVAFEEYFQRGEDYEIETPLLNFSQDKSAIILQCEEMFLKNSPCKYVLCVISKPLKAKSQLHHILKSSRKSEIICAKPNYKIINFRSIVFDFIKAQQKKYIIFDKFVSKEDSMQIRDFISHMDHKTCVLILDSPEFFEQYWQGSITIKNFEESQLAFYAEILNTQISLKSQSVLLELAKKLRAILNGSPKELMLLLNRCNLRLAHCTSDEQIIDIFKSEVQAREKIIDQPISSMILYMVYFAPAGVDYKFLKNVIFLWCDIKEELIEETINNLILQDYLRFSEMRVIATDRTSALIKWTVAKTNDELHRICMAILSQLHLGFNNKTIPYDDINAISIISNVALTLHQIGMPIPNIAFHAIKTYAKSLIKFKKFDMAGDLYSLIIEDMKQETYENIINIAELLYQTGHYTACFKLLLDVNVDNYSPEIKFKHFLLLANCSALSDNRNAIDFYNRAIQQNTSDQLVAVGAKLLVEVETNKTGDMREIIDEYESVVSQEEVFSSRPGYIALLRNALDFQNVVTAIKTMEKALYLAEKFNIEEEIYKIKQNLALNLIKVGRYLEAEKYLNEVLEYCRTFAAKETSYPLINLAVIHIYNYFETNKIEWVVKAREEAMCAIDYATSYYAVTLSNLHYLTVLSILYAQKNNPYNISHDRILWLRHNQYHLIQNNTRDDIRVIVRSFLTLITSACITNDKEEAKTYLKELCNTPDIIGKEAKKINLLLKKLEITDIEPLSEQCIDPICEKYYTETRFNPWLISLTHN